MIGSHTAAITNFGASNTGGRVMLVEYLEGPQNGRRGVPKRFFFKKMPRSDNGKLSLCRKDDRDTVPLVV